VARVAVATAPALGRDGTPSFFVLVEAAETLGVAVPRVGPPLAGGLAVLRAGLDVAVVGVRARDNEAAVGLLKRSAERLLKVTFFVGVGGSGCAFLALARDAAVGAKRPEGVLGRVEEGVLGRAAAPGVGRDGVFERTGVTGVVLATDFRAAAVILAGPVC
jgi:hypothetical protein